MYLKRILFYINTLQRGGAERVMTNLANQFSLHGYDVLLVTSFGEENEYPVEPSVQRENLFPAHIDGGFFKRNYVLTIALRRKIKEFQPDLVVSFMREPNFRAVLANAFLKSKCVVSVRNDPNREYTGVVNRILAKLLFSFCNGIVFQTEDAKQWFPKRIQKKSSIILNQVDDGFFEARHQGERHHIVTAGRLQPQKNHALLIRAFAELAANTEDQLIIYGEGELRPQLEALIDALKLRGRVLLPGATAHVIDAIKSAKIFVLSSDYEGMPNALMEAMALCLTCISTDCPCGGPRTLLRDGENGFLVPVGDQTALREQMDSLLKMDEKALEQIGQAARETAADFRGDIIYQTWEHYLAAVAGV